MTASREELLALAATVMPSIQQLEAECTASVMAIIPEGHTHGTIYPSQEGGDRCTDAFGARDSFYAALMPTEQDAIRVLHAAYERLKALDWNDPIYCPKDGSEFDVIEPGSTGIFPCRYEGEWPTGSWWIYSEGDASPSRPILYRRTEAEKARWASFRARASLTPEGSTR